MTEFTHLLSISRHFQKVVITVGLSKWVPPALWNLQDSKLVCTIRNQGLTEGSRLTCSKK